MAKTKKTIGATDHLDIPQFDLTDIPCKIDTGAYTSTLHCSKVRIVEKDDKTYLAFILFDKKFGITNKKEYRFEDFDERKVRSSNGEVDYRYSIKTNVIIFGEKIKTEFTLSFREKMKFPILLGRKFLKKKFIVDVAQTDISFHQKSNT